MRLVLISSKQVFDSLKDADSLTSYKKFLERYKDLDSPNEKMKGAMTDIAFEMTKRVWQDLKADCRGNCFFCIGGVNSINPFSATAVKNEIVVYVDEMEMSEDFEHVPATEGTFYDMSGNTIPPINFETYDEIYMDFNGSMAFFDETWKSRLGDPAVTKKVEKKRDMH